MFVLSLFGITFLLASAYAAFSTSLGINAKGNLSIDEDCVVNKVWEYSYENKSQDFTAPCSGTYKMELWGAQGGDSIEDVSSGLQATSIGGTGSYVSGSLHISKNKTLYLYVGSQGENRTYNDGIGIALGGYNGGGSGYYGDASGTWAPGAGGSSFISGHNGCVAITENSTENNIIQRLDSNNTTCDEDTTYITCSYHYSDYKFSDTVMIDGAGYNWTTEKGRYVGQIQPDGTVTVGHKGNGYAKITLISRN